MPEFSETVQRILNEFEPNEKVQEYQAILKILRGLEGPVIDTLEQVSQSLSLHHRMLT